MKRVGPKENFYDRISLKEFVHTYLMHIAMVSQPTFRQSNFQGHLSVSYPH